MTKAKLDTSKDVLDWADDADRSRRRNSAAWFSTHPTWAGDLNRCWNADDQIIAERIATAIQDYEHMKSAGITTVDRETVLQNERLRAAFEQWFVRMIKECKCQPYYCCDVCDPLKAGGKFHDAMFPEDAI